MSANSIPTAPAPTTAREPGASFWYRAPVEDQIRSSSILSMGRSRGRDPVAMMMLEASYVAFSPSAPSTSTPRWPPGDRIPGCASPHSS